MKNTFNILLVGAIMISSFLMVLDFYGEQSVKQSCSHIDDNSNFLGCFTTKLISTQEKRDSFYNYFRTQVSKKNLHYKDDIRLSFALEVYVWSYLECDKLKNCIKNTDSDKLLKQELFNCAAEKQKESSCFSLLRNLETQKIIVMNKDDTATYLELKAFYGERL